MTTPAPDPRDDGANARADALLAVTALMVQLYATVWRFGRHRRKHRRLFREDVAWGRRYVDSWGRWARAPDECVGLRVTGESIVGCNNKGRVVWAMGVG